MRKNKDKNKNSKKQTKALFKRHYQALNDSDAVSSDWPQSMAQSSLKRRTEHFTVDKTEALESYKQARYSKALAKAMKVWETQAGWDAPKEPPNQAPNEETPGSSDSQK